MVVQNVSESMRMHQVASAPYRSGLLLAVGMLAALGCSAENQDPPTAKPEIGLGKPRYVRTLPNVANPRYVRTLVDAGKPVAFSPVPNPSILLIGNAHGEIFLVNVRTGQLVAKLSDEQLRLHKCVFSPDGSLIASASGGSFAARPIYCDLRLWDVKSRRPVRILEQLRRRKWHQNYKVRRIAFSPDGKLLAANGPEGKLNLWDTGTGKIARTLTGGDYIFDSLAYSPDGAQVAAVALPIDEDNVYIWDVASGKLVRTLRCSNGNLADRVTFSPDGKLLALASVGDNYIIDLWDRVSGRYAATLRGHTNIIFSLAFRPDSCWLASGSGDDTLRLWDVREKKLVHTLSLGDSVGAVDFSPDGRWLAAQHNRNSPYGSGVSVWDLAKDPTK